MGSEVSAECRLGRVLDYVGWGREKRGAVGCWNRFLLRWRNRFNTGKHRKTQLGRLGDGSVEGVGVYVFFRCV